MGSLILCHKKKARQPYEITRIHLCIHTLEELCYYICNHLYLIDYTLMNQQLCEWLERELQMEKLADKLRAELRQNCSLEQFVLTILQESNMYAVADINRIQAILTDLQNQNEVQREKYKADTLMKNGEYASATLIYQSILGKEWDDSLEKSFYGEIYGCLGTAYGRLFLYEEAAKMYESAYHFCEEPEMLKAYVYSCYRAYPEREFVKMMSGNAAYLSMSSILKEEMDKLSREVDMDMGEEQFREWKKKYRKIDKTSLIC